MKTCKDKTLVLKLGGQCNLHCKHCHCKRIDFKFNPDIIPYIKQEKFTHIRFSGGEPLMYWNIIYDVILNLGDNISYSIVSNGNLLTEDMQKFLQKHNVHFYISYDGEDNESRDIYSFPHWDYFAKLTHKGLAVLYSYENKDIDKLLTDIRDLSSRYSLQNTHKLPMLNFPHQTTINPNPQIDRALAQEYCRIIGRFLELEFMEYQKEKATNGRISNKNTYSVITSVFERMIRKRNIRGVKCCNELKIPMTIDGRFLLCPYDEQYVGDIYSGVDWDKVEGYIPKRCKDCPQWQSCMNICIANVTDNECYISRILYRHFYKLLSKYNVTYEELDAL